MILVTSREVSMPLNFDIRKKATIFFARQLVQFVKLSWGCLNKPYETYRKLALYSYTHQTLFIAVIMSGYFTLAAVTKEGIHEGTLNIILASIKAILAAVVTFGFSVTTLFVIGKYFNGKGSFITFLTLWSFTLLPTLAWFFVSTVSYVVIPPPRTMSILGQGFSALFLAFSIGCLAWKMILYYLTFRFGLKLGTIEIAGISLVAVPLLVLYSLTFYKLGIFKVPFM